MKTKVIPIALMITAVVFYSFKINTSTYTVDASKSTVNWFAAKVTGKHNGKVNVLKGNIEYNGKQIIGGFIEIDMNTIIDEDLTDKEWNSKLVTHLKSDDFFSVEKHPTSKIVITSVTQKSKENFEITGNLTIKGITHPISFPAVVKADDNMIITVANVTINRAKYDVRYGSKSFFEGLGDKAIDDEFKLEVHIAAFNKK